MSSSIEYRKTLGKFATGVTIITTCINKTNLGFTANSFTSVSLDPPLVLFCIKSDANFLHGLQQSEVFGINILSEDQKDLSNKFANPNLMSSERFEGVEISQSALGCPIIQGSLAYLDCQIVKTTEEGDHHIIIGKVLSYDKFHNKGPLLYYSGGYSTLSQ